MTYIKKIQNIIMHTRIWKTWFHLHTCVADYFPSFFVEVFFVDFLGLKKNNIEEIVHIKLDFN